MEPDIQELVFKRIKAAHEETRILYEMSEAEMILLSNLVLQLPFTGCSAQLMGKMLRAAAHLIESTGDVAEQTAKEIKDRRK